jgi:hypothetical protein
MPQRPWAHTQIPRGIDDGHQLICRHDALLA